MFGLRLGRIPHPLLILPQTLTAERRERKKNLKYIPDIYVTILQDNEKLTVALSQLVIFYTVQSSMLNFAQLVATKNATYIVHNNK